MDLTRRQFLFYSTAAVGIVGLHLPEPAPVEPPQGKRDKWRTLVTDGVGRDSESLRGYLGAIPKERRRCCLDERYPLRRCSLLIVPQLGILAPGLVRHLTTALKRGSTVVIESGVGFGSHSTVCQHRHSLCEGLQIRVAAPVDLWTDRSHGQAPYIDFTWPRRAKIRDFSRVVPPAEQQGEIIAWAGDTPVAFRRQVGDGTLIYLGSPVGPALWAGDVEARRWLHAVALAA